MKDQIMQWGMQQNFKGHSDIEIYNTICENFYIRDYEEVRKCNIELFRIFNYPVTGQ